MSAETAVQGALYSALTALGLTVYDSAPQAADGGSLANWPYVEVGTIVFTAYDTYAELGHEFMARIHTRSRSASMKETKDIQGQIWARLHRGALTVTGLTTLTLAREVSEVTRAPDGSFHGVCTYRGLIVTA
jgi:hypothetical protein